MSGRIILGGLKGGLEGDDGSALRRPLHDSAIHCEPGKKNKKGGHQEVRTTHKEWNARRAILTSVELVGIIQTIHGPGRFLCAVSKPFLRRVLLTGLVGEKSSTHIEHILLIRAQMGRTRKEDGKT